MQGRSDAAIKLPIGLRQLTDGTDLEKKDHDALCLLTVDGGGWPRVALLSVGEVLSISPSRIRIALWPNTTTTANLDRTGRGMLMHAEEGAAHYSRLAGRRIEDIVLEDLRLAVFELEVLAVIVDKVEYADILSGVTYRLEHPSLVLERWRQTLNGMKPM